MLIQAVIGCVYVLRVPLWMPSDERAHMRYIHDLMTTHQLHAMQIGDVSYESYQPPLFHSVGASLCLLFGIHGYDDCGYFLRVLCLAFFVCSSYFVAAIFRHAGNRQLILASLCFFALNPSMLGICSSISNDSLSFLLTIVAVYIFSQNKFDLAKPRTAVYIGFWMGLALLCRLTVWPFLIVFFIYLVGSITTGANFLSILRRGIYMTVPVAVILSPWLIWNYSVYGAPTAAGRLIGPSSSYAVQPDPLRDVRRFNYKSYVAYHFLPNEFYYNQIKAPIILQAILGMVVVAGVFGTALLVQDFRNFSQMARNLFTFCGLTYWVNAVSFIITMVLVTTGPARWLLASFECFALLLCTGLFEWSEKFAAKFALHSFAPSIFALMVCLNLYIIIWCFPHLTDLNFRPY